MTEILCEHVSGPVEKQPADNAAGWYWLQRCLRCDVTLHAEHGFSEIGTVELELDDGRVVKRDPRATWQHVPVDHCRPA